MENVLVTIDAPELKVIEASKADQIRATFNVMADMLKGFEAVYNEIIVEADKEINTTVSAKARRLRLDIAKIRSNVENTRKAQKEEYLRAGKAIDGVANILKDAVLSKEKKLQEIEDYAEIQEKKRIAALETERMAELSKYTDDIEGRNLGAMEKEIWDAFISVKRQNFLDRIEAEKKAEADRIENERLDKIANERHYIALQYYHFWESEKYDFRVMPEAEFVKLMDGLQDKKADYDEEQLRIKLENDRLKKEAEEKARFDKIEADKRAKVESDRIAKEKAEQLKRDEIARKEREANEAKLKAERAERERIQRVLDEKKAAEEKAIEKAKKEAEDKLKMNDTAKAASLIADIKDLTIKYSFQSAAYNEMYSKFGTYILKAIASIQAVSKS